MYVSFNKFKEFFNRIEKHNIGTYAAQCAYYTVLSFIPFLITVITLIQYTGITQNTFINAIQNIMPETMLGLTIDIVQEIYSKSIATISISAIFVIWSAGKGFRALLKGLQNIYETTKKNNFISIQIKSVISTVVFVLMCILVLFISVFGDSILNLINIKFGISKNVIAIINFSKIGIYFILFFALLLVYTFIPGHNEKLKKQIPGAIVSTLGCYLISFFFSIYLQIFTGFSVIYGSLTTIVLAMMWVYFCMYLILLGAEVNKSLEKS